MKHVVEKKEVHGTLTKTNIILFDGLVTLQKNAFYQIKNGKKPQVSYGIKVIGLVETDVIQPNFQPAVAKAKTSIKKAWNWIFKITKVEEPAPQRRGPGRKPKVAPVTA